MTDPNRKTASDLAAEFTARNDPLGWFDRLYATAAGDASTIPWANLSPNPMFVQWAESHALDGGNGKRSALVVGCGLGDDAQALSTIGFNVTAFDIAPNAVAWAKKRFPATRVNYVAADLLSPPADWKHRFDFVLEIFTLQAMPAALRATAIERLADFIAPGGTLLIICRARDEAESPGDTVPHRLARSEFAPLLSHGLIEADVEDFYDSEDPPVRRFRIAYSRPNG